MIAKTHYCLFCGCGSETAGAAGPQQARVQAQFVDRNYAALIQKVTSVMAITDELKNKGMLCDEKYSEIRAEQTSQGKMRMLFEALNSGGDGVKNDFYYALRNHEPHLFKDLGKRIYSCC
uniref:Si:ch211-66k16.27 n=1 Tax=Sinocyclocheilus rhinocerous TaxID=307959 RepID=A0A673N187_9TELE